MFFVLDTIRALCTLATAEQYKIGSGFPTYCVGVVGQPMAGKTRADFAVDDW